MSSLFKRSPTTQTQTEKLPSWLESGSQQAVDIARGVATRPYQGYGTQAIAPLAENERRAIELAGSLTGGYQPYLDRANRYSRRATRPFASLGEAGLARYMNPYIKSALDPTARELREQGAIAQRDLAGRQSQIGAFGGSRYALQAAEQERGLQESLSDLYGRGYASAYDQARAAFEADRAAFAGQAGTQAELARMYSALGGADVERLAGTGALERSVDQAKRTQQYKEFLEARDWDIGNLDILLKTISGVPYTRTTTGTTKGGDPSIVAQLAGLAASLTGASIGDVFGRGKGIEGSMIPSGDPWASWGGSLFEGMGATPTGLPPPASTGSEFDIAPFSAGYGYGD